MQGVTSLPVYPSFCKVCNGNLDLLLQRGSGSVGCIQVAEDAACHTTSFLSESVQLQLAATPSRSPYPFLSDFYTSLWNTS